MKYARLPVYTREGEEERSSCPGAGSGAEKTFEAAAGTAGGCTGEMGGPFPSEGSGGELVTTLEIISSES